MFEQGRNLASVCGRNRVDQFFSACKAGGFSPASRLIWVSSGKLPAAAGWPASTNKPVCFASAAALCRGLIGRRYIGIVLDADYARTAELRS